jgi:hypothetical protein
MVDWVTAISICTSMEGDVGTLLVKNIPSHQTKKALLRAVLTVRDPATLRG